MMMRMFPNRNLKEKFNSIILFIIFQSIQYGCSLKLLSVDVPNMVVMGDPIWLNCSYDLENEELYSIKWYHWNANSEAKGEFYRWIPKDSPPGQMFQMEGIHLDLSKSSFGNVYLSKSDIFTDGSFRCEVSAEAPSFQTVRKEKELHIYSLPKEKPIIIQGGNNNNGNDTSNYGPGNLINLTCRTMPSRPPATITWHINHEIADARYVKSLSVVPASPSSYYSSHQHHQYSTSFSPSSSSSSTDGLQATASQLFFYSDRSHYRSGLLKINCISDIILQYTVSSEEVIIGDDSKHKNYSPQMVTESLIKDIPIITGVQHHRDYRPGDIVNLTCISRAKPAPKLSFMVNDEEPNPAQLREYPIFTLGDGSFASKLGLRLKVKMENFGSSSSSSSYKHQQHRYYSSSNSLSRQNQQQQQNPVPIKQYRIKCISSMEKNIYSSTTELHLGTSKQSSGLHFSENFAVNINASPMILIYNIILWLTTMIIMKMAMANDNILLSI